MPAEGARDADGLVPFDIDSSVADDAGRPIRLDLGRRSPVENLDRVDWEPIRELVTVYADLRLGGTDASLVALGERLGVATLATLIRRDFTVVRLRHIDAFELLP